MSYEPNIWVTGNRITAEKLNHMEDGIESANSGDTSLGIKAAFLKPDPYSEGYNILFGDYETLLKCWDNKTGQGTPLVIPLVIYAEPETGMGGAVSNSIKYIFINTLKLATESDWTTVVGIQLDFEDFNGNHQTLYWLPNNTITATKPANAQ